MSARVFMVMTLFALSASGARAQPALPTPDALSKLAPKANREALSTALSAVACAQARGLGRKARTLTVMDYSLPSVEPRLWIFDLREPRLLFEEHVAHGKGSGGNLAKSFSNVEGTFQSSLGLFLTAETYFGKNGYSLKLDGLEPGINDQARARAIVMHGAPYVDPAVGRKQGRLGRSWGCPAVRQEIAVALLDAIRGGSFVLAWYPDDAWLSCSTFIGCEPPTPERTRRRRR